MQGVAGATREEDESTVWRRWREHRDTLDRDALVQAYAPWARKVARDVFMRCRGRTSDWPDYVQNASLGLVEAVASYDERRGVPFEAYARLRVRGAVFNGLRDLASHAPGASDAPGRERVDSLLEGDVADPVDLLVAVVSGLASGHVLESMGSPEACPAPATPYEEAVRSELAGIMAVTMHRLPARERDVLVFHYLNHLAFHQVADMLGVTRGRISQLHRQALQRLRSFMLERHFEQDF